MSLDDQLRSAAADVRAELGPTQAPPFEPPSPTGSRIALLAVVALFIGGGWWASRPGDEAPPLIDAAADSTEASPAGDASSTLPPRTSAGLRGVEEIATSPMDRPGTAASSTEPDTGVAVRRLSSSDDGSVTQPVFSATQTHNADGTLLLLYRTGGEGATKGHVVVDAETGSVVTELDLSDGSDIENVSWDPLDPDTLVFQRSNQLVDVDARTGAFGRVVDFASCTSIGNGASAGSTISQNGIIGFLCAQEGGATQWMAYDRAAALTIPGDVASVEAAPIPAVSGEFFVVADSNELLVFDNDLELLRSVAIEASTLITAQDRNGNDLAVVTVFGGPTEVGTAVTVDLATGAVTVIVGPETGYPYPPSGTQLSTAATNAPHLVAISTNSDVDGVLSNEIMLLDLDGSSSTLSRLAHHRNDGQPVEQWPSTTMVAVSPDGTSVVFSSNWGTSAIDTYEIALPR